MVFAEIAWWTPFLHRISAGVLYRTQPMSYDSYEEPHQIIEKAVTKCIKKMIFLGSFAPILKLFSSLYLKTEQCKVIICIRNIF